MKTMKTRLTALFTAAALALSFAGCGAAASASASVAVDNGQQADYTVGILQYTSHSSLDEIAAAIQSESLLKVPLCALRIRTGQWIHDVTVRKERGQ